MNAELLLLMGMNYTRFEYDYAYNIIGMIIIVCREFDMQGKLPQN